ncbi:hypothetical protein LPJ73_008342, partial [Coemansia sp. RSA 2703]
QPGDARRCARAVDPHFRAGAAQGVYRHDSVRRGVVFVHAADQAHPAAQRHKDWVWRV